MEGFRPTRSGWSANVGPHERQLLATVFTDVLELLGFDATAPETPRGSIAATTSWDSNSMDEDEILAALDFHPGDDGAAGDRPPEDPALARLLPPMHVDDDIAGPLRELTEKSLREGKITALKHVVDELVAPTGPRGTVMVRHGEEQRWLTALNDVRLVLATRLDITDAESAEEVTQRARRTEDVESAMAMLYSALAWWQESLLEALSRRPRSN